MARAAASVRRGGAAVAAAVLLRAGARGCTVTLNHPIQGTCSSSRYGCGPASVSPNAMWTKRGCCGWFDCDNYTTQCCSTSHSETTYCACGPVPQPDMGGTYFVAAGAAPGGNGSSAAPFATVQECADVATHARVPSTCRVGPGLYPGAVRTIGDVDIVGAGAATVLDGSLPVDAAWARHRGAIWKTTLPAGPLRFAVRQLFVDGEHVPEARWPDAPLPRALDAGAWATMKYGSRWGVVADPELSAAGVDFTGARVTMNIGTGEWTYTRDIGAFNASAGTFHYPTALIGIIRPHSVRDEEKLFSGNKYYLSGVPGALDSPGEWWLNTTDWTLYVWAPDGGSPEGRVSVRADLGRYQDTCVTATGAGPGFRLRNLTFRACTFNVQGRGCELSDLDLRYPTYDPAWHRGESAYMPPATVVNGANISISRLRLTHSDTWGLLVVGSNHRVTDTLIESTNWLGSLDFPAIKVGFTMPQPPKLGAGAGEAAGAARLGMVGGSGSVIDRVTVRGFGNSGIVTSQLANTIQYTHVEDGGLIGGDDACIHADNTPTDCNSNNCTKQWHHNWVNNCREKCVRCDDGSEACLIDHTVVFNCGKPLHNGAPSGVMLKGFGHRVYANTIFNTSAGQGDLCAVTAFGENKNSEFWNTAARRIRTKNGPALVSNQTVRFAGGLYENWGNYTDLRMDDPLGFRFAPRAGSPLCGAGVAHPAAPPARGARAPDVGAYACGGGDAWSPGCTFHPRCAPVRPPWPR